MEGKEAKGTYIRPGERFNLTITPKLGPHIATYRTWSNDPKGRVGYYDPKLAKLETEDFGEGLSRTSAVPNADVKTEIEPLPDKDMIYRGMSAEEYDALIRNGEVRSRGDYNIGGPQEGLTYFSTEPGTASYYASGFAPWQYKATFERPAYVIAIKRPAESDIRDVPGTGENEVGVARPIKLNEVVGAWRGDVYAARPGDMDVQLSGHGDNNYTEGSGSSYSSNIGWTRIDNLPGGGGKKAISLRSGFDPSEPRDEHGQWTEGGDGGEGTDVADTRTPASHEELQQAINSVAGKLDFDPSRIDIVPGTNKFVINGRNYVSAGTANLKTGRIQMWAEHNFPGQIEQVVAHEIEHQKFQHAMNLYNRELMDVINDPGPAPNPSSEHWWEREGGQRAVMRADGSLFPPYDQKYPIYSAMHAARYAHTLDEFAAADGVSDYSLEYWKGFKNNDPNVSSDLALHETLAEMAAARHQTGKFPDHWGERIISYRGENTPKPSQAQIAANAKLWRDLYRTVDTIWKGRQKMLELATVAGRPAMVAYLDDKFAPVANAADATLVKVVFTDDEGGSMFLVPESKERGFAAPRARAGYDPSEPRDEGGKWSGDGEAGDEGSQPMKGHEGLKASDLLSHEPVKVDDVVDSVPGAREAVARAREDAANTRPTDRPLGEGGFKQKDGRYAPERSALHYDKLKELFTPEAIRNATPAKGHKPVLTILGGRGGSGKSWFTKSRDEGGGGLVNPNKAIYINSDDFKEKLPEYNGHNAGSVHEESSHIADRAEHVARVGKLNVILDATMRSPGGVQRRIEAYRKAGYSIHGFYMHANPKTAATRALQRFMSGERRQAEGKQKHGGRFVPPEYSVSSTENEKSFDAALPNFSKWAIYTNEGAHPVLYARSKR